MVDKSSAQIAKYINKQSEIKYLREALIAPEIYLEV